MSTRSSARNIFLPLDNPKITIRRRSRADHTLLNNIEMAAEGNGDPPVPGLQTMDESCQPSLNGRGGPIDPIAIQATNIGLKNDMIQQVQNSYQFHGLLGDDTNKHLDKFLHVTQSIKVNGVTDDTLRLYLFPLSLTHNTTAWFDRLPRISINTFEQMAKMFLGKYFPPSMVTKLRNEITNFHQRPDESLFKAWECYKLSIDRCLNHRMLPVTQIDNFYNSLTLRHRDTINAAAGGTFMKRRPKECYDLIENITAHHNDWDTSAQWSELSSSITSFSDTEIAALKYKMAKINKSLMRVLQVNQQVKAVTPNCETCGGRHSFNDCPVTIGQTQNVYAAGAYQGNSYQPQGNRNLLSYRLDNYLGPPGRNQFFQGASHGQNPPPAYQALGYQAQVHQPPIPLLQVVTTNEFTNFMKANDDILKNMQTNMTSLTNSNLELKNMFGQFMKMNTASSSGSETLPDDYIKVGKLHFPPDFVVVDFDADPRVPLILRRSFSKTERALIDVFEGDLTLRVGKEAITFNLDQTSRYSANYNDMTENRIDVIDMACEEYLQEVLDFSDVIASRNPTPYYDPIVSTTFLTLTPFGDSDFLLEEVDAFLALEDDATSPEVDQSYVNTKGDILLLQAFLNDDPSLPPPNQGNYLPQVRKELKICEAKTDKSSINEPPEVELKDLPPHLEYAFLDGDDKLPVIIMKDLSVAVKTALITVLKSQKRAIAWKLSDLKGIDPKFCTHKYLMQMTSNQRFNIYEGSIIKSTMSSKMRIKKTMELFMDDFLEKSYFMVKEGIVLGHKISKNGIEVDKSKVDVIAKLPHPATVKGIRSFLGHAGFYLRFIQYFLKIARPMTRLLEKDTPFFFSKEYVEAL
nr:reverse transcriptase domain-containing protein [Tanacetum cinerariifolium]